jgi:hypothetical protein
MIILLTLVSCTSATRFGSKTNEFVQMNKTWQEKPSKEEVVEYFGPQFKEIEEGISYNYDKTHFTKMAFFFDKNKRLADQFAIVDEVDLSAFKKGIPFRWSEKNTKIREAHVVKTVESGECPEQRVRYFFRQDLGLYEIRWF